MSLYNLTPWDLSIAAILILLLGGIQMLLGLGLARSLLLGTVRMVLQLLLVGLVLKTLFAYATLGWIILMAMVMLGLAGYEVVARQRRRIAGWRGYGVGMMSMSVTALVITVLALTLVIHVEPWYRPQYAIPLLGMVLGNTMTGIGIAINHLTQTAWSDRTRIEGRLMLGHTPELATRMLRRESMRAGLIPTLNMLAAAGLISLPGMMTGQILAGTPPMEAVKYQILIMFLITGATGFGVLIAVQIGTRHLFDDRQRLRLDRLVSKG